MIRCGHLTWLATNLAAMSTLDLFIVNAALKAVGNAVGDEGALALSREA
jgi:hypothetical protein